MTAWPQKNLALDLAKFPDLENKCNESVCPWLEKKKKKSGGISRKKRWQILLLKFLVEAVVCLIT